VGGVEFALYFQFEVDGVLLDALVEITAAPFD
jgi:hypothetical protein